jgi:CheY-like chemotaxis protein
MGSDGGALLGTLLLRYGMVTEAQLEAALQAQDTMEEPLGQILVSLGMLNPSELELALRAQARLRGRPDSGLPYVLIVDDDPEVGAVLGEVLTGAGYSVGVARNEPEALAAISARDESAPSVVVLHLGLAGAPGLSVLSDLRSQLGSDLPIVVTSSRPELEAEIRAEGLAVSEFVVRPVRPRALLGVVERALH